MVVLHLAFVGLSADLVGMVCLHLLIAGRVAGTAKWARSGSTFACVAVSADPIVKRYVQAIPVGPPCR